jgi:hypothetical protein
MVLIDFALIQLSILTDRPSPPKQRSPIPQKTIALNPTHKNDRPQSHPQKRSHPTPPTRVIALQPHRQAIALLGIQVSENFLC